MTINRLRYGVLTTLNQTWFLRKKDHDIDGDTSATSQVEVSNAISCTSTLPSLTLIGAWTAVLMKIEKNSDWMFSSPRSSTVVNHFKDSPFHTYNKIYKPIKLDGLIRWDKIIGRSDTGVVAMGQYMNFPNVVFKTVDISKHRKGLEDEVGFYEKLQNIQGTLIPEFIAFGTLGGMLHVLVLEYVGRPISLEEFQERGKEITSILDCLHSYNVNHGDLRLPNIMIDNTNQIKLIDFGMASLRNGDSADDVENEMSIE
jgi:hypothetical protein